MVPALLVQKVDNTIHWVNLYPVDSAFIGFPQANILIHCIVIYLEDSAISF